MSFNLQLMRCDDPYNKILKNPTPIGDPLAGTLKDDCSLIDPVIMIERDTAPTDVNYCYISEFARYYFIKNIDSYKTGLWSITMHCDVLHTYANGILASPAIAARSSNNFNMMLNDDHYFTQENPHIFTKAFPSGFDTSTASYVLALIGQAATGE